MKTLKRWLYLLHRWFGVVMCLAFALWFASGIVMMYVEYPELTEEERSYFLPRLNLDAINLSIAELETRLPAEKSIQQLTLTTILGRPAFQAQLNDNRLLTVFADTGEVLTAVTPMLAERAAADFTDSGTPQHERLVEMDQWTVSGVLHPYRPLHKVRLNNPANSIVYVSDVTGQVVRDTHGYERTWNWLGSTIHWIYPMQLRRHPALWTDVVIYVSLLGLVSVVTGTVVGFIRLRIKQRYKNGSLSPYKGWQKWHHFLGLTCVIFVAMFLVSGLFSMNPWGIFINNTSPVEQIRRYHGADYALTGLQQALDNLAVQTVPNNLKELHWQFIGGKGFLIGATPSGRKILGYTEQQVDDLLQQTMPTLIPNQLARVDTVAAFDNYYYSTHNRYRPLPVYRAIFSDPDRTWFYIDARSGEMLGRSTRTDRVERWLYNGLHSLDFRFLLAYRPLWDIVVIILSVAGLAFCWTSIVIAWRRTLIKLKIKPKTRYV